MKVNRLKIALDETVLVDIDFEINSSLALVGQSGSGKSLTLKTLLGMLPTTMTSQLDVEADFELEAGKSVAFVPQNPFTALSPLTKIKHQFFVHKERVKSLFDLVDLDLSLLERFPPELSGGQLQRVVIAMALSLSPKLLLLDEPTTALDPDTRTRIIELLKKLQAELGFHMLFVTHDMYAASSLCEHICVIKEGRMVEWGLMSEVLESPKDAYTKILMDATFANRTFRK